MIPRIKPYCYDSGCEELAEHFLIDNGPYGREQVRDLAQTIQDAIEAWLMMDGEKE